MTHFVSRVAALVLAGGVVIAAAPPPLAPADDPVQLVGAAARAKHGIEPLARPADDVGMAEDPAGNEAVPVQAPPAPADSPPPAAAHK